MLDSEETHELGSSEGFERTVDGAPSANERLTVLIVDDEEFFRDIISKFLSRHNFVTRVVDEPANLMAIAKSERPDCILLDINMPMLNGFDLCRTLKQDLDTRDIPVIFITGDDTTESSVSAFQLGGADYISKASDQAEIIARVRTQGRMFKLQQELRTSHDVLATQVEEIEERVRNEASLSTRLRSQQSQLMQAEKMASIGQLAAGIAHEINNPIGFISSNLSSLREYLNGVKQVLEAQRALVDRCLNTDSDDPDAQRARAISQDIDLDFIVADLEDLIGESLEGTQRVRQIVADLRDFSHVDTPNIVLSDLNELLDKTINVVWNEIKYKADIVREYGVVPLLPCYGGQISQVFLNLLVNAAHSLEAHGTITLRTGESHEEGVVWVEIEDTGCGIPHEIRGRIFDPFFTTKDVGTGTGLGLHLSYKIMAGHDGSITLKSEVGQGTTFRLELPLAGPSSDGDEQHA